MQVCEHLLCHHCSALLVFLALNVSWHMYWELNHLNTSVSIFHLHLCYHRHNFASVSLSIPLFNCLSVRPSVSLFLFLCISQKRTANIKYHWCTLPTCSFQDLIGRQKIERLQTLSHNLLMTSYKHSRDN